MHCCWGCDSSQHDSVLVLFSILIELYRFIVWHIDPRSHGIGQFLLWVVLGLVWSWAWVEMCFAYVFELLLSSERVTLVLCLADIHKTFMVVGIRRRDKCSTGSKPFLSGEWIATNLDWWGEHGFGEVVWRLGAAVCEGLYYEFLGVAKRGALGNRWVYLDLEWLRGECCTMWKLLFMVWQ